MEESITRCDASVVITTKNRCKELRNALTSALAQAGVAIEILVIDDGSTDGTSEMVRAEFPAVRLERREESRGLIVRRNEGARLAQGGIVFSMDDDATFSSPHVVAQTLAEFDSTRIGAVAIPFIEPHKANRLLQQAPDASATWVADQYIGTAHAIRRDIFLKLGGYSEHFLHQCEESDYCIRLLGAGRVVRLGRADPIQHHESPKRDNRRMDYHGRRNDILFTWQNVPLPQFPVHLAGTILNGLRASLRASHPDAMLRGTFDGCVGCLTHCKARQPVSAPVYRLYRQLKKSGPLRLSEFESQLPSLKRTAGYTD